MYTESDFDCNDATYHLIVSLKEASHIEGMHCSSGSEINVCTTLTVTSVV